LVILENCKNSTSSYEIVRQYPEMPSLKGRIGASVNVNKNYPITPKAVSFNLGGTGK